MFELNLNKVFATNINFLVHISLQSFSAQVKEIHILIIPIIFVIIITRKVIIIVENE